MPKTEDIEDSTSQTTNLNSTFTFARNEATDNNDHQVVETAFNKDDEFESNNTVIERFAAT